MNSNLHLVTGYAGEEHVTSSDEGSLNAALMGEGQFVMERGNQFAASIISNNKVRVADGDILMQGRHIRLKENTYVDLNFDNGAQGYKRNDLIVVRYTKDSTTDKEEANLVVIKGTPSETTPSDPEYISGDIIHEHALENDMLLYRVPFDGLNIQPIVSLFNTVPTWETLKAQTVASVKKEVNALIIETNQKVDEAIGELVKVHVTTDEQLIGQTITVTNGSKTYAKIVPDTMELDFGLPVLGTWTFSNPITGTTKSINTVYYGQYYVELACYKVFSAIIDFSMSNPDSMVTYADDAEGMTGGSSDWWNQPIYNTLRNCLLADGGEVLGYLKKDNLTQYENGANAPITTVGNDVMLEIPQKVGYSIEWADSQKLKVSVTDNPNDEAFNYDAFSLDSYNDCDKIYIGVYKGYCTGSKAYSSSGKSVTVSQTIDTFRTWCRNRGKGYQQRTYASVKLMQCLLIIFYKGLNSQANCGYGYVASGHSAGVSTGGTNGYGFMSEVIKSTNPTYMTDQNHQVKCFGIEDFWGNYWEFVDGLCSDSARNVLTCTCAKDFDTDGTGYDNNGNGGVTANIGNYMNRPQGGSKAGFTAQSVAGSDSTYFCDYAHLYASCLAVFGGYWTHASDAGAFRLHVYYAFSFSSAAVACRLMYLHKEAA
jgi:hypothetical protein|nr:MAG TPA: tail collar fiber protein [Caudoviricetes sp.]